MIITTNGPQNVGQIEKHFKFGDLFLSPEEYQRENAWNIDQKKLLIDTIFRGMDIPKIYFWKIDLKTLSKGYPDGETKKLYKDILTKKMEDNDDPSPFLYEVVDGQQRIRTIFEFMGVKLPNDKVYRGSWNEPFSTLEDTPMAKGKFYAQLNVQQQIKFEEKSLTIMILEDSQIDEIRDMFLRLQNGTPLKAQQKRDAFGSSISKTIREVCDYPFFSKSVQFGNDGGAHHLVASQMLHLEIKGKIVSCTSRQLDKLYEHYKKATVDPEVIKKYKKVIKILGDIFPTKNPHLNRSYALSLYWAISQISNAYNIPAKEYDKIKGSFENLDDMRLTAMNRDYANKPDDDIFFSLSLSMSRGTDGIDGILTRHEIIPQFLFENVDLQLFPDLDPKRNFTYEEKLILYKRAKYRCQLEHDGNICGKLLEFDDVVADHIIPHSRQGKTELDNGRIAYSLCNIARGNRSDFNPKTMCKLIIEENT